MQMQVVERCDSATLAWCVRAFELDISRQDYGRMRLAVGDRVAISQASCAAPAWARAGFSCVGTRGPRTINTSIVRSWV